jgi:hypothetical protein
MVEGLGSIRVHLFSQPHGHWSVQFRCFHDTGMIMHISKSFMFFLVMPYWLGLCILRMRIENRFSNPHVVIFAKPNIIIIIMIQAISIGQSIPFGCNGP